LLKSDVFTITVEGTYSILLPESIVNPFIEKRFTRAQFKATYGNKHIMFHGALRKRKGNYQVMFSKQKQKDLDLAVGDSFQLQLIEDITKYGVEMPESLEAVLDSDPMALSIFKRLTDGKKRSIIYYIKRIKNVQTRVDKALIVTENLKLGVTDLKELTKPQR